VRAKDDLGLVARVVDERIVEAPVRRSGVQGDVLDPERPEQVDDDVGPVLLLRYLPTPRFSASTTNESSMAFVTSKVLTFGFVAASASLV
jgi:hypothetical protein